MNVNANINITVNINDKSADNIEDIVNPIIDRKIIESFRKFYDGYCKQNMKDIYKSKS